MWSINKKISMGVSPILEFSLSKDDVYRTTYKAPPNSHFTIGGQLLIAYNLN
jgi:hypothetical protein